MTCSPISAGGYLGASVDGSTPSPSAVCRPVCASLSRNIRGSLVDVMLGIRLCLQCIYMIHVKFTVPDTCQLVSPRFSEVRGREDFPEPPMNYTNVKPFSGPLNEALLPVISLLPDEVHQELLRNREKILPVRLYISRSSWESSWSFAQRRRRQHFSEEYAENFATQKDYAGLKMKVPDRGEAGILCPGLQHPKLSWAYYSLPAT